MSAHESNRSAYADTMVAADCALQPSSSAGGANQRWNASVATEWLLASMARQRSSVGCVGQILVISSVGIASTTASKSVPRRSVVDVADTGSDPCSKSVPASRRAAPSTSWSHNGWSGQQSRPATWTNGW